MNTVKTIEDISPLFHEELKDLYPKGELDSFVVLTINSLFNIPSEEIHFRRRHPIAVKEAEKIYSILNELKTEKPIQYILGRADFYGCKIRVDENVLIPRPETEELVDLIISETLNSKLQNPNVLDIGTGSGCIAVALKKNIPDANISAIDISAEALLIAKENAILNQTKIIFLQADILKIPESSDPKIIKFDIIVSNPPYVRLSEKEKMSKNVLDYEPYQALFVNDDDPLIFYKAIANFALQNLSPTGKLYFEIDEAMGNEVKKLLEEKGFKNVEIKKDMCGKERMIVAAAGSSSSK